MNSPPASGARQKPSPASHGTGDRRALSASAHNAAGKRSWRASREGVSVGRLP